MNPKVTTECNGATDMLVTVRQIEKYHKCQSIVSPDRIWKPYVDQLLNQGHSGEEIQRLLHEAAQTTMKCDDYRLQDVFNYINTKAKQQRAKTAPSSVAFVAAQKNTESAAFEQSQSTNIFQSIKSNQTMDCHNEIVTRPLSSISVNNLFILENKNREF